MKALPAKPFAAKPVIPSVRAANTQPAPKKFLMIGQPVRLLNASGKTGGTGPVFRRLATLGWTMRPMDARVQPATTLYYSVQNIAAARALQRTLPFPARLVVDRAKGSGMRLVIGRDYISWKPKNARLAALWQKGAVVAFVQKASIKGAR